MWVGAKSYKKELEQFVEECVHRTATSFDAVCPSGGSVCAVLLSSTGRELEAKWSELDRYHSSLFEGGVEHKSLCASVACWFQDSGWGWTTVVPYASGRGDVATTKRNPRINAECGNLTMGIWKLTTAVDAGQAVLYVPFNNEARGWLLEPTEETHQNSALRLWREHCAATRDPW